jgi:5-methylcytosine-specific restriction endonuclease McrA
VRALLTEGVTKAEIARRLGVSKSTVTYHAARTGMAIDERCARRYDWDAVQAFYDLGNSVSACVRHFGFSRQSWNAARVRGAVVTRPQAMPLAELCAPGARRGRWHLKRRLIRLGLKEPRCERCGIETWRGAPLSLALHHRNGDGPDNRLENLELLCPNCHSQTENFSGRNRRPARAA